MKMKMTLQIGVILYFSLLGYVFAFDTVYISHYLDTKTNEDVHSFYIIPNISLEVCIDNCKVSKRCKFINFVARSSACFLLGTEVGVDISTAGVMTKLDNIPGYIFGIKSDWDIVDEGICTTCSDLGPCLNDTTALDPTSTETCLSSGCNDPSMETTVVYGNQYMPENSIKYYCDTDYNLYISTTNIASCQTDGQWTATDFQCIYDCGTMTIENGNFFSTSGTEEGESAFLSCNTGYILVGDHVINCTSSGWDGNGVCTPIDCGDPTPLYGSTDSVVHTYNSVVSVACNSGLVLIGSSTIVCQANGVWNDYPYCDCSDFILSNGGSSLAYGPVGKYATLSCNPGYVLTGSSLVTCSEFGWDGSAVCNYIDCGDPTPLNATANSSVYTYNSVLKITCNTGLTLSGASTITCQSDGTWSASPTCGCGNNQQMFENSCYEIRSKRTWSLAKSDCESIGGHLVDIHSSAEQAFIKSLIQGNDDSSPYWTGGNDKQTEMKFRWSDNSLISDGYTYWHSSQPDELYDAEDCVNIIPDGSFKFRWNDNRCYYEYYGICEIDL